MPTTDKPARKTAPRRSTSSRPLGVVGRMKPTKAREVLRQMASENDPAEDARTVEALDAMLTEGRA